MNVRLLSNSELKPPTPGIQCKFLVGLNQNCVKTPNGVTPRVESTRNRDSTMHCGQFVDPKSKFEYSLALAQNQQDNERKMDDIMKNLKQSIELNNFKYASNSSTVNNNTPGLSLNDNSTLNIEVGDDMYTDIGRNYISTPSTKNIRRNPISPISPFFGCKSLKISQQYLAYQQQ